MKSTESSRQQLLQSLKIISQCDYLSVTDSFQSKNERFSVGEIKPEIAQLQAVKDRGFIHECEHDLCEHIVALSAVSDHFIEIHIRTHRAQSANITSAERRSKAPQNNDNRTLSITLYRAKKFADWLLSLSVDASHPKGLENIEDPIVKLFFNQCLCLFDSLRAFSQLHALTEDSLTKLHSRGAMQRAIDEHAQTSSMTLCMIHCRDFQIVNRKFGQAKGDRVLNEIAKIINDYTREGDLACRFGGALFGIASEANGLNDGLALAQKLQTELHSRPYLQNAIRLSFNLGVAHIEQHESLSEDQNKSSLLIARAEQALKAAQTSDKPSIVHWEADRFKHDEQEFNYIGGIFTPDNVTNYRNMLLLWDISSIIADEHEFHRLLCNVVERLAYTFEFETAGIISLDDNAPFAQSLSICENAEVTQKPLSQLDLLNELRTVTNKALHDGQHLEHKHKHEKILAIPLGAQLNACFYIIGKEKSLELTHDSIMLFAGFARQIGKALKRSQLEEELNKQLEQQNAQLEQELNTLKTGLKSSALVYRSNVMKKVVEQTQRAAQTDTTILVTGESGTGKEKLIHAIHSFSPRSDKALVIVDCGSIPETLIESELFGYVKGAFTGAQTSTIGKIQAADGGILVLDEIGELPLSMQPKLLRFVQEKQFTQVGGNQAIKVDLKIVAVTNRDLEKEVDKGHFRQDLYYRLNVVSLHNPPLRERIEDLGLLSQHFLTKFASQFESSRKFLSESTLTKMGDYAWPGNIRELENKLMQASLMCDGEEISFADLNIDASNDNFTADKDDETHSDEHNPYASQALPPSVVDASSAMSDEAWSIQFKEHLRQLLNEILQNIRYQEFGLGTIIEKALFMHIGDCLKTNRQIAARLQIPVSTARRKMMKYQSSPLPLLPESFHSVDDLLKRVAYGNTAINAPLDAIRRMIVAAVLELETSSISHAANLVGVSEPTFYKLKKQL